MENVFSNMTARTWAAYVSISRALTFTVAVATMVATVCEGQLLSKQFRSIDRDDVIFMHQLLFHSTTETTTECAALCMKDAACLTFTFTPGSQTGSCRGHSWFINEYSVWSVNVGSRTYQMSVDPGMEAVTRYKDGGWTIIQRRFDGSVDFGRNWTDFQYGFGNPLGEFWLGLEQVHSMTSAGRYKVRFDLEQWDSTAGFAVYSNFSIGPSSDGYRLSFGEYINGNITDRLNHNAGMMFTTPDRDNDVAPDNCALRRMSCWWHTGCTYININSIYYNQSDCVTWNCPFWAGFGPFERTTLKSTLMRMRPML